MSSGKRIVALAEVKDLLVHETTERELTYEKRLALEHAEHFSFLTLDIAKQLIAELTTLERISNERATKIADVLPLSHDELRPLFIRERFTLTTEEMDEILEIVQKYVDLNDREGA